MFFAGCKSHHICIFCLSFENTPRRPDITLKFGDERKYMSLDPKYDEFWQAESSPNGGLIRLNADDPNDDKPQWGGIAM